MVMFMGDATTAEFTFSNNPESLRANDLIEESFQEEGQARVEEFVIISSESLTVDDPEFQSFAEGIHDDILGLDGGIVVEGINYFITTAPSFVSEDRHTTFMVFYMAGDEDEGFENSSELRTVTIDKEHEGDFKVVLTGEGNVGKDINATAEETLRSAEVFGLPVAVVILIIIFGALVAAAVPLILAAVAIIMAIGITALVGQGWQMSFFVINMIVMMGLAVGTDYALFIVSRYREERARGLDKLDAIIKTGSTASHAVLFSGLTVILALAGLLIVPMSLFRSLAAGAIFVVAMAILATLTLLPAVLFLLGRRIRSKWIHNLFRRSSSSGDDEPVANIDKTGGFWDWESRLVMRQPVISLILSAGLLIALALPALPIERFDFGIETGQATMDSFPEDLPAIQGFFKLQEEFPFAFAPEAVVVVSGDVESADVQAGIADFKSAMVLDGDSFGEPTGDDVYSEDGQLVILKFPLAYEAVSREATDKIEELREEVVPAAFEGVDAEVLITGTAAENLDYYNTTDSYRWLVIPIVLGLSFILLTIVFRSLVVPLKAIIMNLLAVFATYGLLVLVFQKGYGNEIFGFEQVATVDAWIPLFLFAILFGLSMDYHVFLLSRIRERYLQTGDNTESVAFGLRTTGGIITGAALIMVAIFGGFASGPLVMFQQMGFGMAIAVLLDATIIRSILVPASMRLLGNRNWYLPTWLEWLPEIHVEGESEEDTD
jgi:RND superfamily putative drug exporter